MADIIPFMRGPHISMACNGTEFVVGVHGIDLLKGAAGTRPMFPEALRLAVDLMILGGVPLIVQPMSVEEYGLGRWKK